MKDVRIKETENEQLVRAALGDTADYKNFNMAEQSVENLIAKEKKAKFNEEVTKYEEMIDANKAECEKNLNELGFDFNAVEIKPIMNRVIIKPFRINPFQKEEREGSIITDIGGYDPHIEYNPKTGKNEEQKPDVVVGVVVEIGPDVKYVREGDAVFYRDPTTIPVPFMRQGLVSVAETQLIAHVNVGLQDRLNVIKNNE